MTGDAPIDPGVQAERTLLAWRRTCLALAVGYAAGAHLLAPVLGRAAPALGLGGLAAVALTWALPHARYRRWRAHLAEDPTGLRVGGAPFAVMTVLVVLTGVAGLVVVARV